MAVVGVALLAASIGLVAILGATLTDSAIEHATSRAAEIGAEIAEGNLRTGAVTTREDDEVVQVIDADGRVIAWSEQTATLGPVVDLPPGATIRATMPWEPRIDYVVVATSAPSPTGPLAVLVGRALDDVADATRIVTDLVIIGLPLLLIVVAVTTWTAVGRTLSPVEAIRREVDEISANALERRVPQPGGADEIARLAATMNRMLGRLQDAQTRQRRFVSDASHELRSPVASIRQHAEVALAHPDRQTVRELAETVLAEDLRVQVLVDDLLLLARADEGTLGDGRRPTDLDDVVLEEARRVAATSSLIIDLSAVSAGRVLGDAAQLRRLTSNLLDNAVRHARTRVDVGMAEVGESVILHVADDGTGIAPEDEDRVFERFVRLDDGRSRAEGGAGLGLAIVAETAAAHGGDVSVVRQPGGGARFEVRLPRLRD